MFGIVRGMPHGVDVTIARPLGERMWRFLASVHHRTNRVTRFEGGDGRVTVTVGMAGTGRTHSLRTAASEVARILPGCSDEKYSEPRET
jgi:hypothetical protein